MFLESDQLKGSKDFDPVLKSQMEKVDRLLDTVGIPSAGNMEVGPLDEIMEGNALQFKHVLEAHNGKACPPGVLVCFTYFIPIYLLTICTIIDYGSC